jgi:hypothetical protein
MKIAASIILAAAASVGAFAPTAHNGRYTTAAKIATGDELPSATVFEAAFPDVKTFDIAEYSKGKNMIIVGLPGAFTPT